jgi:MFS transporter, putative metabolite:H+ symporter
MDALAPLPVSEASIAARIERLPMSGWHFRMRVIIGMATFFDAFDLLTIAAILPTLSALWKLNPQQIGWLISVGFIGQATGAIVFGYLAEKIGRVKVAIICISVFSILSICCAFAQSYDQLVWLRCLQGIGLGGEVPIAATYINEIAKSHKRGRFFVVYECIFLLGVAVCSLVGAFVVPRYGYHWMFIIGGIAALITIPLRRYCPESPRWLASRGRLAEADESLRKIERIIARTHQLPEPDVTKVNVVRHSDTRWTELFEGLYKRRTFVVWSLWFFTFLLSYGLSTWLPTIYRTVYHVPVQEALWFGAITTVVSLIAGLVCALFIDSVGRKNWMTISLAIAAIALLLLAYASPSSLIETATSATVAYACINTVGLILYLYTPELYPTRMRAMGTAWATFWPRVASVAGTSMVGYVLPIYGVNGVFAVFGCATAIGCAVCLLGGIETREKVLEELSP